MTKLEFISSLRARLSGVPKNELDERISFYAEAIDDRIEDGLTEEEAVADIGTVDGIAEEILSEIPMAKLVREKIKPKKRLRAWEIVLLALGSPVWIPLIIAAFVVILALYVSAWSVIVSLWAVFASLVGCAIGGIVGSLALFVAEHSLTALALFGAGIFLCGLSIFAFIGCKGATKGILILTKKAALGIKKCFMRKEEIK